jgi:hypothetical protein
MRHFDLIIELTGKDAWQDMGAEFGDCIMHKLMHEISSPSLLINWVKQHLCVI